MVGEDPRECNLARRLPNSFRDGMDLVDKDEILGEILI